MAKTKTNHYQHLKHVKNQTELDEESNLAAARKLENDQAELEAKGYGSATKHGRQQMVKRLKDPETGQRIRLPELLATELDFGRGNRSLAKAGYKVFSGYVNEAIKLSTVLTPDGKPQPQGHPPGEPTYCGGAEDAREVAIVIGLKAVVDALQPHSDQDRKWTPAAALICRLAEQLKIQLGDALAYLTDARHLKNVEKYWTGSEQAPKNRRANQVRYQKKIAGEINRAEVMAQFTKNECHYSLAGFIIAVIAKHGDLIEKKNDKAKMGHKDGLTHFKATEAFVKKYATLAAHLAKIAHLQHPMIEKPTDWEEVRDEEDDDGSVVRGCDNHSGGFHADHLREINPLIRRRYGESNTNASPSLIGLLNKLQSTAFTADRDMADALKFASDHRLDGVDGVHHRPKYGVQELEQMSEQRKADIAAGVISPTEEQAAEWKAEQGARFSNAIREEKRYLRTLYNIQLLDLLKQWGPERKLWFPFSADYRTRVYPQVSGITPQGTAAERRVLKFADGCKVKDNPKVMDEVHLAIGTAFIGTKVSLDERKAWGQQNTLRLLSDLSGQPDDIVTIARWGADEAWDALALVREYQRAVLGDELWHCSIGIDATASGLQWLSALRGDVRGMVNSNVIQLGGGGWSVDPIDGYTVITEMALELLSSPEQCARLTTPEWAEKRQLDARVMRRMREILKMSGSRKLTKGVSMPCWYGCGIGTTKDNIRDCLNSDKFSDDVLSFGTEDEDWILSLRTVQGLSDYLRMSLRLVYPSALETLSWLKSLARKSLANQLRKKPDQMPTLSWLMHDDQIISFWETKRRCKGIKVAGWGELLTPVDADTDQPDLRSMRDAFAPCFIHGYDAALLRAIVRNWKGKYPINTIHDQIDVLPIHLPRLRKEIAKGFKEVVECNPLAALPKMIGTPRSRPIGCVTGLMDDNPISPYMFN